MIVGEAERVHKHPNPATICIDMLQNKSSSVIIAETFSLLDHFGQISTRN
jgi:hypothetical protein